jgi:hypothetical protein
MSPRAQVRWHQKSLRMDIVQHDKGEGDISEAPSSPGRAKPKTASVLPLCWGRFLGHSHIQTATIYPSAGRWTI